MRPSGARPEADALPAKRGGRSRAFSLLPHSLPAWLTDPVARAVARTGITPNGVTTLGLIGNLGAGVLAARGDFLAAGIVVLVAGSLDLVDGALARATGRATPFGAVFDATVDRLSEAAVLGGLIFLFSQGGHRQEVVLAFAAVVGSVLVSYVRAQAKSFDLDLRDGLFTRPERVVVLGIGLIVDQVLIALWILAVVAGITALQRLYVVWRRLPSGPTGGR